MLLVKEGTSKATNLYQDSGRHADRSESAKHSSKMWLGHFTRVDSSRSAHHARTEADHQPACNVNDDDDKLTWIFSETFKISILEFSYLSSVRLNSN